ncbi:hypothetical protein FOXB_11552 [Fusarium oxysporum f. sp. conglutinans Fo5176]|uniref:Uncharacterized protein n=1 Tax=Fusarium oxysporum (strain Fo5176) TaxID=660025 RepID=F9FYS0_FUSOF|nr:hypothetical protein FOXB_11552 [Fusarium oxysporum f. sp. conglutinans Fo5176]KAI8397327.1 hypothetical protein FOFC_20599 [Fusarium oxysporum]
MSVSLAWQSDNFCGLTPHQLETLYAPIILEYALQKVGTLPAYSHESQSTEKYEAEMPDLKAFQFYVNKLAQVCDNERGGNTISALAILRGPLGPHYVFGSNWKDARGLKTTKSFVRALLDLVGKNPENLQTAALVKRVLWLILAFNIPRLQEYLKLLSAAVQECLESCKRRKEDEKDKSISDCETLIKTITNLEQAEINTMISQRAKDGEMTRSEPWCKLRHFLGRWLSYRKAALGIVAVSKRWPELFLDFEVIMVPSGSRLPNPILRSDLTSSIIMQHIVAQDKSQDLQLLQEAKDLEQMGIDDIIRASQISRNFRPLLHAEVLVYEHLLKSGQTAVECYWNRWNYIGSSKPTCRLCHYYFQALQGDKPGVRSTHNNLYRNWRLPEYHEDESLGLARDELLSKLAKRLRTDVVETLKEKKIRRKARDSNTYSSFPDILRMNDNSSVSIDSPNRESTASTDKQDESVVQLEGATGAMNLGDSYK